LFEQHRAETAVKRNEKDNNISSANAQAYAH
jgi:hypothetical protein